MGAWSADAFGNDTGCDWAYDLEDEEDLSLIEETLEIVVEEDDYLDADDACEGLAACEVLARLKGNWGARNSHTETADKWVETHPIKPSAEIIKLGESAIDRILAEESELRELWEESDASEWLASVKDLRQRLTA